MALDRAVEAFWRGGYDGTSVRDLVEAMGIGRASLYAAFGDKRDLFARAMARFRAVSGQRLAAVIGGRRRALESLRAYFESMAAPPNAPGRRAGCMVCNAAAELGGEDAALDREMLLGFESTEAFFFDLLVRARREGDLAGRSDAELRRLARFLLASQTGLRVLGRSPIPERVLRDAVEVVLAALSTTRR